MDLSKYMAGAIILSGTPSESMKAMAQKFPQNVIGCSPAEAMDQNYICKPILNLVKFDNNNQLISAAVSIVWHEQEYAKLRNEKFSTRILFCLNNIDTIQSIWATIRKDSFFDKWHLIGIHSDKDIESNDGTTRRLKPFIDAEKTADWSMDKCLVSADKAFDALDDLDDNKLINGYDFNDGNPTLVFQVNMLSEGVNVKSFNAVMITSNEPVKQMQQIGRVLRDYVITEDNIEYHKKNRDYGHAAIYCCYSNQKDLENMFYNLEQDCDLSSDEWDWGCHADVSQGSSPNPDADTYAEEISYSWEPIDEMFIETLQDCELNASCRAIRNKTGLSEISLSEIIEYLAENPELVKQLNISSKTKTGLTKKLKEIKEKKPNQETEIKEGSKIKPQVKSDIYMVIARELLNLRRYYGLYKGYTLKDEYETPEAFYEAITSFSCGDETFGRLLYNAFSEMNIYSKLN